MVDLEESVGAASSARWRRVRSVLLALLTIEAAVLIVTGVPLFFVYRPTAAQAWGDIATLKDDVTLSMRLRDLHRWATWLLLPTGVAAGLAITLGRRPMVGGVGGVVRAVGVIVLPVLATITGYLLAWDQLALAAITVGSDIEGYRILLDDDVRFVLIGGVEVSPSTILRTLAVHVALAVTLVGIVGSLWWSRRRPAQD